MDVQLTETEKNVKSKKGTSTILPNESFYNFVDRFLPVSRAVHAATSVRIWFLFAAQLNHYL
jgi:hypothetical protein